MVVRSCGILTANSDGTRLFKYPWQNVGTYGIRLRCFGHSHCPSRGGNIVAVSEVRIELN